jgi:AraC-like DNA-binding protein
MINQRSNIYNKKLFESFLKDGLSIAICSATLVLFISIYFLSLRKDDLIVYPDLKNFQPFFYNDSIDHGLTEITSAIVSDSVVGMQFILKDGFMRPYAGIGFEKPKLKEFDISAYNRVKVVLSGKRIQPIFVYLVLKDSSVSFDGNVLGFRHFWQYIEIDEHKREFNLERNKFITPDWWYDKYNLSPAKVDPPQWERAFQLSITTGLTQLQNQEKSISVFEIKLYRDNRLAILLMVLAQLIIMWGLLFWHYLRTRPRTKSVTINYQPVTSQKKLEHKPDFFDFINRNFQNSELSLRMIAKSTGINQRKIAETISEQFNCNVKTYINQIRINEAQRLLKESGLNISEVAYMVGFSSPSNFNRVFKNMVEMSPSEYMQQVHN